MRPQPLIAVYDVEASSRWYQRLLGVRSDHGGPDYERLVTRDGTLVMQLHRWEVEHDHGAIGNPTLPRGNGVLLWFEIEDFDSAVERSRELRASVVLDVHRNPPDGEPGGPAHRELWIRDLDGYTVVVASPAGEPPCPWRPRRVHSVGAAPRTMSDAGFGSPHTAPDEPPNHQNIIFLPA